MRGGPASDGAGKKVLEVPDRSVERIDEVISAEDNGLFARRLFAHPSVRPNANFITTPLFFPNDPRQSASVLSCSGQDEQAIGVPEVIRKIAELDQTGHQQLGWFVKAGMSPEQALRAATVNGAELLAMEKSLGAIRPGFLADIAAVEGDPLADIGILADAKKISAILHDGDEVDRSQPISERRRMAHERGFNVSTARLGRAEANRRRSKP